MLNFDGIEIPAPILYPKVRLVHHARSGQSKCLIWAGGQSRESLCHLPVRHNFSNLNHDKISAVIREVSFKVKTPFKTLKFLSLLLPIFFSIHISPFCQLSYSRALGLTMWLHLKYVVSFDCDEGAEWKGPKIHELWSQGKTILRRGVANFADIVDYLIEFSPRHRIFSLFKVLIEGPFAMDHLIMLRDCQPEDPKGRPYKIEKTSKMGR